MKKLFLGLCLIVLSSFGLNAQITATIGSVTAEPGTVVNIPITVSGANGSNIFGTSDLKFVYTSGISVANGQFVNYSTYAPSTGWLGNLAAGADYILNGYSDPAMGDVSVPDGTVIFEIQVLYTGPNAVTITWDPIVSYFSSFNGENRVTTWVNGGITPPTPAIVPPVLTAPADLAINLPVATQLSWEAAANATGYQVQVSTVNTFATTVADENVTGLTYNLTNLNNATTYFWRVKSTTASGSSAWSATRSFTTVMATPATVTLLTPADVATEIATAPTLTWNSAANATNYRLQVSTDNTFATTVANEVVATTTKAITGLFNATTYYWRVQSINGTINGTWSAVRSFTTEASTVAVPSLQASNLVFTNTSATATTLRWTRGNGENVLVVRYPGNTVNGNPIKGVPYEVGATIGAGTVVYKGNGKTCTVSGLTAGTQYTFKVYEYLNEGPGYTVVDGNLNPRSKTTTYILSTPTNLTISDVASSSATATWAYTAEADFYEVAIATDADFTNIVPDYLGADFGANVASFEGLNPNQQYFVRVRASIDNLLSPWSNVATFTTIFSEPTVAPTALVMNDRTANTFNVSWTAGNGTRTIVYASTLAITAQPLDNTTYTANADFSAGTPVSGAKVVYNGNGTTFELSGLAPETKYYLAAFTYNGTDGAQNYSLTSATANGTTFAAEPTAAPTALVFSNRTQNSIKLNWTGNASKYIVFAKTNANAQIPEPVDGTTYTVGATSVPNVTVAGIVTTAEFTHTSLLTNQIYYYEVYAFNGGNANENYNTNKLAGNTKTLAVVPTAGPATLTISGISSSSMTATWAAVTGVSKYLVLRSTSPITVAPVNGVVYTTESLIGTASVISVNSDLTKLNEGLTAATRYYFRAYAMNGSNGSEVYSTQFAEANAYTFATAPAMPTNFTTSNRTRTSMTIAWNNSNTPTKNLVFMDTVPNFEFIHPVAGQNYTEGANKIVYVGEANTKTLSNLLENKTYYFKIYAIAGDGVTANYSEVFSANDSTKSTAVKMDIVSPTPANVESGATFAVTVALFNDENERMNPAPNTVVTLAKVTGSGTIYGTMTATVADNGTATFNGLSYFGSDEFKLNATTVVNTKTLYSDKIIRIAAAAPTQQDRAILFSAVRNDGMTVKWTKGNGSDRILVMNEGSAVTFTPVDTVKYIDGQSVDGHVIKYVGTGNQAIVNGLGNGKTYTFRVFNYNNPDSPKYCPATGTFNPRSRATLSKGEVAPQDELTEADINNNTFFVGTINPNPVVNSINFKMTKHEEMNMTVSIFDAAGREVAKLVNNQLQAIGTHDYSFNLDNSIASGTYLLVVTAGEQTAVQTFSVVK